MSFPSPRTAVLVAVSVLTTASGVRAQDQVEIVAPKPRVCSAFADSATPALAKLTLDRIPSLIDTALKSGAALSPDTSWIIHVVRHRDDQPVVQRANWYTYNSTWSAKQSWADWLYDQRARKHFTETRLFGARNVGVVYLHHNVPTISIDDAIVAAYNAIEPLQQAKRAQLVNRAGLTDSAYSEAVRKLTKSAKDQLDSIARATALPQALVSPRASAPNDTLTELAAVKAALYAVSTVRAVIDGTEPSAFRLVDARTKSSLAPLGNGLLTNLAFQPLNALAYETAITKKTSAPMQNLQAVAAIALAQAGAEPIAIAIKSRQSICGGGVFPVMHVPSDMAVTATITDEAQKQKELGKQTFDNESRYWWDVSFAQPLKSYDDLTYDASSGTVSAKSTKKANLFAVLNLGVPFDTKNARLSLIPRLLYGLPITGKPLKHHLVGLAIGLNKAQVFAGYVFNQDDDPPKTTASGVVESDSHSWSHSFSWGLNLPVSTVTSLLKSKK